MAVADATAKSAKAVEAMSAAETAEDIAEATISAGSGVSAALKSSFIRTLYRTRHVGKALKEVSGFDSKVMISPRLSKPF